MKTPIKKVPFHPAFVFLYALKKQYKFMFGGRGGGKSEAAAFTLLMLSREKKCRILCVREVQKSIKESVYSLLKRWADRLEIAGEFEFQKTVISHKGTGSTFFFTGLRDHTAETIQSYDDIDYCWVEEAQSISAKSLEILVPTITIRKPDAEIWFTYNRKLPLDPVHAFFQSSIKKGVKKSIKRTVYDGKSLEWTFYENETIASTYANYTSNPFLGERAIATAENLKEEDYDRYKHVYLGFPQPQGDMAIFSSQEIVSAMDRTIETPEGGVVLGVDVARMGADRTVIYKRKGLKIIDCVVIKKSRLTYVVDAIKKICTKDDLINIDDSGLGGGVTDGLLRDGYKARGMTASAKAVQPDKYGNANSECFFNLKDLIGECDLPYDAELLEELTTREFTYDSKDRKILIPKEKQKKVIGRSPDKADAIALCFAPRGAEIVETIAFDMPI